jgi:hypothetical protein
MRVMTARSMKSSPQWRCACPATPAAVQCRTQPCSCRWVALAGADLKTKPAVLLCYKYGSMSYGKDGRLADRPWPAFWCCTCGLLNRPDLANRACPPDSAAAIPPMVTEVLIQCKNVRSLAAGKSEIEVRHIGHPKLQLLTIKHSSPTHCGVPKNAFASVRRSSPPVIVVCF